MAESDPNRDRDPISYEPNIALIYSMSRVNSPFNTNFRHCAKVFALE